ncbi:thiopurine S-methyltransferase [Thiohalomonas denitrificans]|uniref:thiopurine S-methyltransferase n=1 Tax=Thiohalomonas denitrificans TaxID=415747 RepID=UPI0026EFCA07|nr:thiopurine S-methyltransferase [Thiohalomonas denitrificans]
MDVEFWLDRWVRGETGFHQPEVNTHLQTFWDRLELAPGARVLVPLCGKSLDMLWLLSEGYQVLGVEVSPLAVQNFFAENDIPAEVVPSDPFTRYRADDLEILCGDFFDLTPERLKGVGGVYDRASLVALPPAMRKRYTDHLKVLFPGKLEALLVTMEYPEGEMDGPPFSIGEQEVHALYGDNCDIERLTVFDLLDEAPRFRDKGLTRLQETVFRLHSRR